jgi:hypothetical protein
VLVRAVREVEAAVAEMLGVSPTAAAHYMRTLKEADPPLWFRVGSGNRRAPLSISHLVNVVLAFVGGSPVEGPANVALLRGLRVEDMYYPNRPDEPHEFHGGRMQKPVKICGFTIYPTLGETLESIVVEGRMVAVEITPKRRMFEVGVLVVDPHRSDTCYILFTTADAQTADEAERQERQWLKGAAISTTITLRPRLFDQMAELLGLPTPGAASASPETESDARLGIFPPSSLGLPLTDDTPRTKNAALPGAAPSQDQSSIPTVNTSDPTVAGASPQPSSSRRPGSSPKSKRKD